jgi:hypothetical protein
VDAAEWDRWVEYSGPLCYFGVKNFGVKAFPQASHIGLYVRGVLPEYRNGMGLLLFGSK